MGLVNKTGERRSLRWRAMVLEAMAWLAAAWVAVRLLPFRWITPYLGELVDPGETVAPAAAAPVRPVLDVSYAIQRARRRLPWESTCLMQAIAGRAMLKRRGFHTILYLGVRLDKQDGFGAHAWLQCEGMVVTGQDVKNSFTPLASFRG